MSIYLYKKSMLRLSTLKYVNRLNKTVFYCYKNY